MSVREYIGARYVPIFATPYEWDKTKTYEPLTIVYYSGNSYTSRQYVPADTDILNENYWALTGNYNSQIEQYRKDVKQVITDLATEETTRANADTTLQTNIDNESKTRANADTTLQTNINILSSYVYNLSDFEGNTSEEKFKKAMSTLTNGTIIGTKISITSPFDVASTSTDYRTLILSGFSFDCSSSNIFTSSKPDSSLAVDNSVPQFINSDFTNGTIYDDFNVISPTFTACVFNNSSIINSTTKFIQSPYFSQCQILKTTKDFINTNNVYNAIFTNTKIERGSGHIIYTNNIINNFVATNCVMEGRDTSLFEIATSYSFIIKNCYFEDNFAPIIEAINTNYSIYITFCNNYVVYNSSPTNKTFLLKGADTVSPVWIYDNWFMVLHITSEYVLSDITIDQTLRRHYNVTNSVNNTLVKLMSSRPYVINPYRPEITYNNNILTATATINGAPVWLNTADIFNISIYGQTNITSVVIQDFVNIKFGIVWDSSLKPNIKIINEYKSNTSLSYTLAVSEAIYSDASITIKLSVTGFTSAEYAKCILTMDGGICTQRMV